MIEGITSYRGGSRLIYIGVGGVFHVVYYDTRIQAESFLRKRARDKKLAAELEESKRPKRKKKHVDARHPDLPVGICQYRFLQRRNGKEVWYDCIRTCYQDNGKDRFFMRTFGRSRTREQAKIQVIKFVEKRKENL